MRCIRIRRGLDLAIAGRPDPAITAGRPVRTVAVLGRDYPGYRARLRVEPGARVRLGDPLFSLGEHPDLCVTSPGSGAVTGIERGARRALVAVVVALEGEDEVRFVAHAPETLGDLARDDVVALLLRSGLWTALRERPFDRVPAPDAAPQALFVTGMNTGPLAPDVEAIVAAAREDFHAGLVTLSRLATASVFLCCTPGSSVAPDDVPGVTAVAFAGPHPAGLPGTHMHHLAPVDRDHPAWHVGYQDVIAIGRLFTTGRLDVERTVALGGPSLARPRVVRTRLGASLTELLAGDLPDGAARTISGSVLHGHEAAGAEAYLGRFHDQVAVLPEDPRGSARTSTALHGRRTTMVPVADFERVLPFDMPPAPLLRALLVGDVERARDLGCLELAEEDLGLCTYVCPAKQDYGRLLRATLERLAEEG